MASGDPVNLERPLRFGGALGGHLVLGHVDGVGTVDTVTRVESTTRVRVMLPSRDLEPLLIPQGSVAVDGVSLTVAALGDRCFEVMLIPHTLAVTTLGRLKPGQAANIEADVIGKYLVRSLALRGIDMTGFSTIEEGIEEIRQGRILLVVDDEDRENEGDLVMAADRGDAGGCELHGQARSRPDLRADARRAPRRAQDHDDGVATTPRPWAPRSRSPSTPAAGVTTGTSAYDRAVTIRTLVDPPMRADDLTRPGHIFPLRAMAGGVLRRAGHTEAAIDLARLAGCYPAGVICEVLDEDGGMARVPRADRARRPRTASR